MTQYNDLQNICVQVFGTVSGVTSILLLPLFMTRIIFSNVLGEGGKVFQILKGAVIYFILIAGFPLILDLLFSIPESFLPIYKGPSVFKPNQPAEIGLSTIPFMLDTILEILLATLYWIVYYLHLFFMVLMCSMAPIVFLTSALLGIGMGIEVFIGLMIVGSSWPVIWYGFDQVHVSLVMKNSDGFGMKCLELLITILKGIAPASFALLAVKSPMGKAVTQMAKASVSSTRWIMKSPKPPKSTHSKKTIQKVQNSRSEKMIQQNRTQSPQNLDSENPVKKQLERLNKAQAQLKAQRKEKGQKNENPRPRNT